MVPLALAPFDGVSNADPGLLSVTFGDNSGGFVTVIFDLAQLDSAQLNSTQSPS